MAHLDVEEEAMSLSQTHQAKLLLSNSLVQTDLWKWTTTQKLISMPKDIKAVHVFKCLSYFLFSRRQRSYFCVCVTFSFNNAYHLPTIKIYLPLIFPKCQWIFLATGYRAIKCNLQSSWVVLKILEALPSSKFEKLTLMLNS